MTVAPDLLTPRGALRGPYRLGNSQTRQRLILGPWRVEPTSGPLDSSPRAAVEQVEADQKRLKRVTNTRVFETQFQSPQLLLWELGPEDWHLVVRLPEYAPRRRPVAAAAQLPLLPEAATPTG